MQDNNRIPILHASTHKRNGSDAILLDELGVPTDITLLNATAAYHGLLPKLADVTNQFLNAKGQWAVPPSVAGSPWATDGSQTYLNTLTDRVIIGATGLTSHPGDQERVLVKKDQSSSTILRVENYDTTASGDAESTLMVACSGNIGGVVLAMGPNVSPRGGYLAGETVFSTYGLATGLCLRTGSDVPIRLLHNETEYLRTDSTKGIWSKTTMYSDGAITIRSDVAGTGTALIVDNRHASGNAVLRVGNNPAGANTGVNLDYQNSDNSARLQNATGDMSVGTTGAGKKLYLVSDVARVYIAGGMFPVTNNDIPLGDSTHKWTDLWVVNAVHTGDVMMDDDKMDSHWTIREAKKKGEDKDTLYAVNRRTKKKFKFVLEPIKK